MTDDAPCFARLQVIRDPIGHPGAFNMALDEVLLATVSNRPLLRLYTWDAPTVSFGYFETSLAVSRVTQGRAIVRRWTGGGIVEHGDDLTYSLCVPRSCEFYSLRSVESYRRIHASIARALCRCGLPSELHDGPALAAQDSMRGNACFERPVLHDLLAGGRKIAGGAQRRSRAGLLHQGSVKVVTVEEVDRVDWKSRLWRELPDAMSVLCEERPLTPDEISRANTLASVKYATAAWTHRF